MLLAFHGKKSIKAKFLNRVAKHVKADSLVQNYGYWEDGKGCAVGCTIHSSDHGEYETQLGIPKTLAYLEDRIFERLPVKDARKWPSRFLSTPKVGADLSLVWPRFAVWLLIDEKDGVMRFAKKEKTIAAIQKVAKLWQRVIDGEKLGDLKKEFAAAAADAAAAAAADAAAAAAAATDAAATYTDAAAAAAADAAAAAAAAYTEAAVRIIHWKKCADKLISLMSEA